MGSDVTVTCPLSQRKVTSTGSRKAPHPLSRMVTRSAPILLKIHQESEHTLDHILFCQTCDCHFSDHDIATMIQKSRCSAVQVPVTNFNLDRRVSSVVVCSPRACVWICSLA